MLLGFWRKRGWSLSEVKDGKCQYVSYLDKICMAGLSFFFTSSLIVIWFQSITFSQVLGHEKVIKQWNVTNVILSVPGYRHGNPINTVNIFCSWSRYTLTSILVGFFFISSSTLYPDFQLSAFITHAPGMVSGKLRSPL